jgi:hypothetical protein
VARSQYYIAKALEKYFEVVCVEPLMPGSVTINKALQKLSLPGRRYLYMYTKSFSKALSQRAEERLATEA